MGERRPGLVTLLVGLVAIAAVQRVAPLLSPPLFDGVVIVEPYRWLLPPVGEVANPTSDSGTHALEKGASPLIALATSEEPPQAQIFLVPGALILPPGTKSIATSISPVMPAVLPTSGHIHGNVYRISVTNQAGVELTTPSRFKSSVTLRGPGHESDVTMERLTYEGWKPLKTTDAGFGQTFVAVVTAFGDFALVAPGPGGPYPSPSPGVAGSGSIGSPNASAPDPEATAPPGAEASSSIMPSEDDPAALDRPGRLPTVVVAGLIALVILGSLGLVVTQWRARRGRS